MSRICSSKEVREMTGSGRGIFVLFYAPWCPFSQAFLPVFEKHAEGRDTDFVRVLLDGNEHLFNEHGIEVYPTVLFFKDGKVSRRLDGQHLVGLKENQLADLIVSCAR